MQMSRRQYFDADYDRLPTSLCHKHHDLISVHSFLSDPAQREWVAIMTVYPPVSMNLDAFSLSAPSVVEALCKTSEMTYKIECMKSANGKTAALLISTQLHGATHERIYLLVESCLQLNMNVILSSLVSFRLDAAEWHKAACPSINIPYLEQMWVDHWLLAPIASRLFDRLGDCPTHGPVCYFFHHHDLSSRWTRYPAAWTTLAGRHFIRRKLDEGCLDPSPPSSLHATVEQELLEAEEADLMRLKIGSGVNWKKRLPKCVAACAPLLESGLEDSSLLGKRKREHASVLPSLLAAATSISINKSNVRSDLMHVDVDENSAKRVKLTLSDGTFKPIPAATNSLNSSLSASENDLTCSFDASMLLADEIL